ncbi:unnamed protein product [Calypogeia fissa]
MAEEGFGNSVSNMHNIVYPPPVEIPQGQTPVVEELFTSHSPTHVLSPASSLDSEESLLDPDDDPSLGVDLAPSQEDQIEKLKEFLSEAQVRGDDLVTQKDADTVKNLENMQIAASSSSTADAMGLGARLESAARANLEIEKQTAAGYFPSETVYLQEHTLRDVLGDVGSNSVLGVTLTASVANKRSPQTTSAAAAAASPIRSPRSIDAENALKDELDCLFEERAGRFRLE